MTSANEQEQVVCDFLRKLCPGRDWMYLGEVEHLWIAEMVGAINATAGVGTCVYVPDQMGFTWWDENDVEHYEEHSAGDECYSASCDKCKYAMMVGDDGWFDGWDEITEWWEEDGSYHKGYILEPRFRHCPNCGRKVIGIKEEAE